MPDAASQNPDDASSSSSTGKRIVRPHDARVVRSRSALGQALLELIQKKSFQHITIREITEQAGLSYPVFFRQFANTEELLHAVATQQVRNLLGYTAEAFASKGESQLEELCDYVDAHRSLWTSLLTAGASEAMRQEFARISDEIAASRSRTNPHLPPDLITELVTNAIFDILTWWMKQPANYPKANVVKLLDALVVKPYSTRLKLDLE